MSKTTRILPFVHSGDIKFNPIAISRTAPLKKIALCKFSVRVGLLDIYKIINLKNLRKGKI